MWLTKQARKDKQLLAKLREYDAANKRAHEFGHWEPVTPYTKGWLRDFVLRDDMQNRTDARELRNALAVVNTVRYWHRKDFLSWSGVPLRQHLRVLGEKEWSKLSRPVAQKFTAVTAYIDEYGRPVRVTHARYQFKLADTPYVMFRVQPNVVTEHWVPDSAWESYLAELRDYLWHNPENWRRLSRLQAGHTFKDRDYNDRRHRFRNSIGYSFSEADIRDDS